MSNNIYNNISLFLGTALSVALHSAVIFLIYAYIQRNEDKVIYVQAELWSALPPESKDSSSVPNELSREIENPLIRNTPKNSNTLMDEGKKSDAPDDIGLAKEKERKEKLAKEKERKEKLAKEKERKEKLAKEKERKEKLAKEKERKEKLAKEKAKLIASQRQSEMARLKNSLPGIDKSSNKYSEGRSNATLAGLIGGSDDGQRVGELADYAEKIKSKIKRKIVFNLDKIKTNPNVVFSVLRENRVYSKIELRKSSGNLKWDSAVRAAIRESLPLPPPSQTEIPVPPKELILSFRPRDK
ncbi:MAG: hypothetical protein CBC42_04250 [Betaproteobacteria bacterium TMED82]|nr:MAG: hypothetical protein CBC42_04250 [Betaproteobacteria bacterium TMED82]